jgi:hypothetical protein
MQTSVISKRSVILTRTNVITTLTTVILTHTKVITTRRVWWWHIYVSKPHSACRNHSCKWCTRTLWFKHAQKWCLHAECDVDTYKCDNDTYKCDNDTYKCDFDTHESGYDIHTCQNHTLRVEITRVMNTRTLWWTHARAHAKCRV